MCPVCVANIALLATTSSGGVAALALNIFRNRKQPKEARQQNEKNRTEIKSRSGISEGVGGYAPAASREREGVH